MSVKQDFEVHLTLQTDALKTLRNGVPPGLPAQLEEVSTILAAYDAAVAEVERDKHLTIEGKAAKLRALAAKGHTEVENWLTVKRNGIDSQTTAQRAALQVQVDKLFPAPTDMQIQTMTQRLAAFDPLEVDILYSDATDAERRVIEAAADAIGRQPRKRGEALVWEPLISPERVAAMREARVQRANPEAVAALGDTQRIGNVDHSMATTALALLRESVPGYASGPDVPEVFAPVA